jgi:hypothetical protein
LNCGNSRRQVEHAISTKEAWEYYLVIIWEEDRDPCVLMLEESEFSPEIGERVKGHGLSIILPLKKCLAGLGA